MVAGVLIFVLAFLSWNAESQFLSGTGFQHPIPNTAFSSPCGCSSVNKFLAPSGPTALNCGSFLSNAGTQCDTIPLNLGSHESKSGCGLPSQQFLSPAGSCAPNLRESVFYNIQPQCDCAASNLGSLREAYECDFSTSKILGPLAQTLRTTGLRNTGPQCESSSSLEVFGKGPCNSFLNLNAPSNFPSISNWGIQSPLFISNGPKCGLNNFADSITNQVTETITSQVPFIPGKNQFVSETFFTQNPCQPCSSLCQNGIPPTLPNIRQFNDNRNCASPVIETCISTVDDDESLSNTLANALQLLIVSNLIENLNEAAALGTFTSPSCNVIENISGCQNLLAPITSIETGCSHIPSLCSLPPVGSLSSNPFGAPCQKSCNTRLRESINPIRVPPLGAFGGIPEIVNSKISCGAPHIPDVINPTNLKLAEAINSHLPFGPLPSYNGNFPDCVNSINLPSLLQPSVLPEIGNPVNLPVFGFPNNADGNPFNVQCFSPLAPTPGLVAYNVPNGPLQVPEVFNYNQFNGPLLSDVYNYNGPLQSENFNYNQFHEPFGPLLPDVEGNPFNIQCYSPLAPTPELVAYNVPYGPLQIPEAFNYNQFNGPLLPDVYNYNRPILPEILNYNQLNEPYNPLMALLKQLLAGKSNSYVTPFASQDTYYNPYSSHYGAYQEQNPCGEAYVSPSEINNQYGSGYPVSSKSELLELISSKTPNGAIKEILAPFLSSLGKAPYIENSEVTLPISLSSPSYAWGAYPQTSTSSCNNGFADFSSSVNPYSQPAIAYVPVDIPGAPVTLSGTLPEVPFSVTPLECFTEVKDIPVQFTLEPLMAELLIPSSIPAELLVSF